tara:strand:+ start:105 stop:812 length:708 start_codon:yes stop_codon:yes gene_type:complete
MKKSVMFGLDCRALKKQFGKLFLVSRQSEAPQGANGSCGYAKRGAMFGLDARIALAIFGALSVISGAALYSAIQESKIVAYITSLEEVEKALEAYYLDTGTYPTLVANDHFGLEKLVVDPTDVPGWGGPYIGLEASSPRYLEFRVLGGAVLGVNYGKDTNWTSRINCTSMLAGQTCSLWMATQWSAKSIAEAIDIRVDGALGVSTGNVRLMCDTAGHMGECTIYYKSDLPSNVKA